MKAGCNLSKCVQGAMSKWATHSTKNSTGRSHISICTFKYVAVVTRYLTQYLSSPQWLQKKHDDLVMVLLPLVKQRLGLHEQTSKIVQRSIYQTGWQDQIQPTNTAGGKDVTDMKG